MSQQINLFDASLRPRRDSLNAATMVISFVVVLCALLAYDQYARRQLVRLELQLAASDSQAKDLQSRVAQLGGARAPDKALAEEVSRTEAQLRKWQELLDRLSGIGIGNTQGHARFLEALARQHAEGVWLTQITVGDSGDDFALKGRMLSSDLLGRYIEALNRDETLRGRAIGQIDISRAAPRGKGADSTAQVKQAPGATDTGFVEFSIASAAKLPQAGAAQ